MTKPISALLAALVACFTLGVPIAARADGRTCHVEQRCHWVNFKKICVYETVCR
jgi:hypothetical protein